MRIKRDNFRGLRAIGAAISVLTLAACATSALNASAEPDGQSTLPALINDGFEGESALKFDWAV